jgi:nitroreductase
MKWHLNLIDQDAERIGDPNARSIKLRRKYYGMLMPVFYFNDGFGLMGLFRRISTFFVGLRRPIVRGEGHAGQRISVHKSCALAAENFMLSCAAQGYHTCPMEGFDAKMVKKQLNLPRGAEINMVIAVGKGTKEGFWGPRRRVDDAEVIKYH